MIAIELRNEGLYYLPDYPEKVSVCSAFKGSDDGMKVLECSFPLTKSCPCGMRWFSYRQQVERSKANAIRVKNQDEVGEWLCQHVELDTVYFLPDGYKVERVQDMYAYAYDPYNTKFLALISPLES